MRSLMIAFVCLLMACTGCGDESLAPPANPYIALVMDSTTVEPGSEVFLCQAFNGMLPKGGTITRFVSNSPGSHHITVYGARGQFKAGLQQGRCEIPSQDTVTLAAVQGSSLGYKFPQGVGLGVDSGTVFLVENHFVNTTRTPKTVGLEIDLYLGEASILAGGYWFNNTTIELPPGVRKLEERSCSVDREVSLLTAYVHMHRQGLSSYAAVNGKVVFQASTWEDPPQATFAYPGEPVPSGESVSWGCDYLNPTTRTIGYGASGINDEMCNFVGYFIPARYPGDSINCVR